MNRQLIGVAVGSFITGVGVGFLAVVQTVERKTRKEYEESQQALVNALSRSRTINVYAETPAAVEADLIDAAVSERDRRMEEAEGEVLVQPTNVFDKSDAIKEEVEKTPELEGDAVPEYINHYKKALEAKETPTQMFVDGGINDYGVSYIEEDDYDEEDGRFKGQITIVMDQHNADFFMDGVQITDWAERVGESIIVDFYQLVPPGAPPILYVRNHKRDEDYEVTREV